jgi:hypothetical protein
VRNSLGIYAGYGRLRGGGGREADAAEYGNDQLDRIFHRAALPIR